MTTLLLDLSGRHARYLILDQGLPSVTGTFPGPIAEPGNIGTLLAELSRTTGRRFDHAHLIMPDREVTDSSYTLQEMPLADAEKIVSRRIASISGESDPLVRLTPLSMAGHQRVFLAEQCSRATSSAFLSGFTSAKIPLKTLTTPLQAMLGALTSLRPEMLQPEAVFNIDGGTVTTLFLSATEILHCSRTPLPLPEETSEEADEAGRARKRRLFDILNLLHGIYSQYMLDNPRFHVGKVWLCGAEAGLDGLTESLADAMDIEVDLLRLLPGTTVESQAFALLAGLAAICDQPERSNFLADKSSRPLHLPTGTVRMIAGGVVAIVVVSMVLITENRIAKLNQELAETSRKVRLAEASTPGAGALANNLEFLRNTGGSNVPFYDILKALAQKLPKTVLLDSLRYITGKESNSLELVLVTAATEGEQAETVFSSITGMLDEIPYLAHYADPTIAIIREGDRKLVQVTITCTVPPPGGAKR